MRPLAPRARRALVVLTSTLALPGAVSAQERPRAPDAAREGARNVALARFLEPLEAKDLEAAERGWDELARQFPDVLDTPRLRFRAAELHARLNRTARAIEDLEAILERDPAHVGALLLLARLRAASGEARHLAEAKELLVSAARHGSYVLRELHEKRDPVFEPLRRDPDFILRVMRAPTEPAAPTSGVRNPFQTPWRDVLAATREQPTAAERTRLDQLARTIDLKLEALSALAREGDVDAIALALAELDGLFEEYRRAGHDPERRLEAWERRGVAMKELALGARLRVLVGEGEHLVRRMSEQLDEGKLDLVPVTFASVERLVERMRRQEVEEFTRNADHVLARARGLRDEAAKLAKIRRLELVVTGVVKDRRTPERDRAIVNDRIYEKGDAIVDKDGLEIAGLRLVGIDEGTVRFRYEGVEVTRRLDAR